MEHILTLALIKKYNLETVPFDDSRTKFLMGRHYEDAMTYMKDYKEMGGCKFQDDFGPDCEKKISDVLDTFMKAVQDYACKPFDKVINMYDKYSTSTWLFEKLGNKISGQEMVHYAVATASRNSMMDNMIDTISDEILHYPKV